MSLPPFQKGFPAKSYSELVCLITPVHIEAASSLSDKYFGQLSYITSAYSVMGLIPLLKSRS